MTKIFYQVNATSLFGNKFVTSPVFEEFDEAMAFASKLPWYMTKYIIRIRKWIKEEGK